MAAGAVRGCRARLRGAPWVSPSDDSVGRGDGRQAVRQGRAKPSPPSPSSHRAAVVASVRAEHPEI